MAANTISQLTTANTFQHWLIATQSLIGTANTLTNGNGNTFFANTRLEVGGTNATLNVVTSATVNDLIGNTANVVTVQIRNLTLTENVTSTFKTTSSATVGTDLTVHGNSTITGNTLISGDLTVSGSGSFANTLSVTGNSTFSNANVTSVLTANIAIITTANITSANISTTTGIIASANITTANIVNLVGTANTAIYAAISNAEGTALAFSIALG